MTETMVAMGAGLERLFLIAAVLVPVPILPISITLTWAVQRRRRRGVHPGLPGTRPGSHSRISPFLP